MRTKQEILDAYSDWVTSKTSKNVPEFEKYYFLEVQVDIRDQLAELVAILKEGVTVFDGGKV